MIINNISSDSSHNCTFVVKTMNPQTSLPSRKSQDKKQYDAFAYYSNDYVRMRSLLFLDDDNLETDYASSGTRNQNNSNFGNATRVSDGADGADGADAAAGPRTLPNNVQEQEMARANGFRKKRLSFEVHDSLIMFPLIYPETATALGLDRYIEPQMNVDEDNADHGLVSDFDSNSDPGEEMEN